MKQTLTNETLFALNLVKQGVAEFYTLQSKDTHCHIAGFGWVQGKHIGRRIYLCKGYWEIEPSKDAQKRQQFRMSKTMSRA